MTKRQKFPLANEEEENNPTRAMNQIAKIKNHIRFIRRQKLILCSHKTRELLLLCFEVNLSIFPRQPWNAFTTSMRKVVHRSRFTVKQDIKYAGFKKGERMWRDSPSFNRKIFFHSCNSMCTFYYSTLCDFVYWWENSNDNSETLA